MSCTQSSDASAPLLEGAIESQATKSAQVNATHHVVSTSAFNDEASGLIASKVASHAVDVDESVQDIIRPISVLELFPKT